MCSDPDRSRSMSIVCLCVSTEHSASAQSMSTQRTLHYFCRDVPAPGGAYIMWTVLNLMDNHLVIFSSCHFFSKESRSHFILLLLKMEQSYLNQVQIYTVFLNLNIHRCRRYQNHHVKCNIFPEIPD